MPVITLTIKESQFYQDANDSSEDLIISKETHTFNDDTPEPQNESSAATAAVLEKNKESVAAATATVSTSVQATSGAVVGAGFVFGPIFSVLLGALFKFFQVMDNIGNLALLNIKYGPLTTMIFDVIDSIQIAPDMDKDTWIS
jgi:ABC-type Fe3+ transport system permease subunit